MRCYPAGDYLGASTLRARSSRTLGLWTGGLANADGICQVAADDAGLGGTYKAWLSDNTASPSTRFTHATQPYVLPNGVQVAADWADLTDSRLDNPIVINPFGQTLLPGQEQSVWTG